MGATNKLRIVADVIGLIRCIGSIGSNDCEVVVITLLVSATEREVKELFHLVDISCCYGCIIACMKREVNASLFVN